jgi:UDP-N-acetylglucosamine 3-dehydrogenase
MRKIRYAVIGVGWFGEKHCEAIAGLPNAELAALCTRNPARLREVAARFGVKHTFTDYRELLTSDAAEAVSITTMWDQHTAPTPAALGAGKHVFLEKPMASTVDDCRAIVRAAHSARGRFMVGHICRFNPRYAAAKTAIAEGRIGKIVSMYARRNLPRSIVAGVLDKIGPIIGDGVHDTDLMLWYSGAKVVSAYAQTLNATGKKYPDIGWTTYRFDSGAIGVLENIWYLPDQTAFQIDERMEIVGTEGAISIHDTHPNFSITDRDGWRSPDTTYWPLQHGVRSGALRAELAYFVDCIAQGKPPSIITPEESLAAVAACLLAERSAQSGEVERIPEEQGET